MSIRWTSNQSPGTGWWEMEFRERSQYSGDGDLWWQSGGTTEAGFVTENPCERLLTWEGYLHRGLPRGRGTGLLGWLLWKSVVSDGSRMSLASTQDLTSGPYPSQSKRYCRTPPRHRESRISWTWYASSPSMMRQGGPWFRASSRSSVLLGAPAALSKETWKMGEIWCWGGKAKRLETGVIC